MKAVGKNEVFAKWVNLRMLRSTFEVCKLISQALNHFVATA